MKHLVLSVMVVLAITACVNAGLTSVTCDDDGDGVIEMNGINKSFTTPVSDTLLEFNCIHHNDPEYGINGNVQGDFTTDTELDPSVRIVQTITNDTGFDWTEYTIYVRMNKTFQFLSTPVDMPTGWTATFNPVAGINAGAGSLPSGGLSGYVGSVTYAKGSGGSAIADGSDVTFGFKVSFLGSVQYCTEQVPVPEPISLAMFGLGGLALARVHRVRV